MDKTEFLTIFPTYSKIEIVRKVLPSVIEETKRNDAKLIVHDSTESSHGQTEKWEYLRNLSKNNDFFMILSTNMSMAHARNMCLRLGQELYAPDYICLLEDDHGYGKGLIPAMIEAAKKYYGKLSPNGLRYGMFTACYKHTNAKLEKIDDMFSFPISDNLPFEIGGSNSCFRFAPTSHWNNVLKGYDTDEYLISEFQTGNLRWRNYHKGYTVLFVGSDELVFSFDEGGRGVSFNKTMKLYDRNFCASDDRSIYLGKKGDNVKPETDELRKKMLNHLNRDTTNPHINMIRKLFNKYVLRHQ
ncbi:MAG: glycosyltransferase family 2 protein [Nitrospinales bacterium]